VSGAVRTRGKEEEKRGEKRTLNKRREQRIGQKRNETPLTGRLSLQ